MASYTMDKLYEKYEGFAAPTAKIKLGDDMISAKGWRVRSVESTTCVGEDSGICTIVLSGVYDMKSSKFLCEDALLRGTVVVVSLGYVTTEEVFTGFLYEVDYELRGDGEPTATMVCMDIKAAMMGGGVHDFSGNMTYKQVVEGFFTGKNARGYSTLSPAPTMSAAALKQPVSFLPQQMDDYAFLTFISRQFGLECFVSKGALLLREKPASPTELISLTPSDGVESITVRLRSAGYIKSVSVLGGNDDERDSEKKHTKGMANNSFELASEGSDAGRIVGARKLEVFAANICDDSTAQSFAEGLLRQRQTLASELTLDIRGLPELLPGFSLTLSKVSTKLNGNWYVTSVSHKMYENSFSTRVLARREI